MDKGLNWEEGQECHTCFVSVMYKQHHEWLSQRKVLCVIACMLLKYLMLEQYLRELLLLYAAKLLLAAPSLTWSHQQPLTLQIAALQQLCMQCKTEHTQMYIQSLFHSLSLSFLHSLQFVSASLKPTDIRKRIKNAFQNRVCSFHCDDFLSLSILQSAGVLIESDGLSAEAHCCSHHSCFCQVRRFHTATVLFNLKRTFAFLKGSLSPETSPTPCRLALCL